MSTEKESKPQSKISDLPEPANAQRDADMVKGGRMSSNPTESGDVTQNGTSGGDTG
jgi:hypothetical protein